MRSSNSHSFRGWARTCLRVGLGLLFPTRCAGCGMQGAVWCDRCNQALMLLDGGVCEVCGAQLRRKGLCRDCVSRVFPLRARSYAFYRGPLVSALLQLKYRRNEELAATMARWLVGLYRKTGWTSDLVVAVPLGQTRMRQRGYNQAALIASAFTRDIGLAYSETALLRHKETRSQVGLDMVERGRNVEGAFLANDREVRGKTILVVDDLYTTGATLLSCAKALLNVGAAEVLGLTVGRASGGPVRGA